MKGLSKIIDTSQVNVDAAENIFICFQSFVTASGFVFRHDSSKIRNPWKEQKCKIAAISCIVGGPTMSEANTPEEILKTDPSRLAKNTLSRN